MYFSKRHDIRNLTETVLSTPEYRTIRQVAHIDIKILTKFKVSKKTTGPRAVEVGLQTLS